jgi:hypothetical protein
LAGSAAEIHAFAAGTLLLPRLHLCQEDLVSAPEAEQVRSKEPEYGEAQQGEALGPILHDPAVLFRDPQVEVEEPAHPVELARHRGYRAPDQLPQQPAGIVLRREIPAAEGRFGQALTLCRRRVRRET